MFLILILVLSSLFGYSTYFKAKKALEWERHVDEVEAWKAEKVLKFKQYEAWKANLKPVLTLKVSDFNISVLPDLDVFIGRILNALDQELGIGQYEPQMSYIDPKHFWAMHEDIVLL